MTQPLPLNDVLEWLPEIPFTVAREAGATWIEIAHELDVTEEQARRRAGI